MALKKTWYEIVAPKMFDEAVIGHTLASDPKQLKNRKIKISLADINRSYSKFYMKMHFQIHDVKGTKALSKFTGHNCTTERMYRMVQRRTRRVDAVQKCTTKDDVKIRIKSILILVKRTSTSTKDSVRTKMKDVVENYVKQKSLEELMKDIINDELQKKIRSECKKIYPVGAVEIRSSEVLS